jgi:hypothetical protein
MPSDHLDRDKKYAGGTDDSDGDYELAPLDDGPAAVKPARATKFDDDDDGGELELEPVDAEIIAGEKRRADEAVEEAKRAINIDAIYREVEPVRDLDFSKDVVDKFRFQFQLKHLLIATAVVAVMLALYKLDLLGPTLIVLFMLAVFSATAYFHWEDKKRQAEADRRRHEMYAARRAQLEASRTGRSVPISDVSPGGDRARTPFDDSGELPQPKIERPRLKFQFSLGQFLIAFTCAAVLLAVMSIAGGPQAVAVLFGIIALGGIVYFALGFEVPEAVAFVWWILLVLYVVLSIFSAIWAAIRGA